MSNYLFSFIVASYARKEELRALLESLSNQTFKNYEIIVVDQNAHECVRSICDEQENVIYMHSVKKGLSYARNIGIRAANGDYLIFPDDDATIKSDFLENSNEIISTFPEKSIFSGMVLTLEENKPFSRYMDQRAENLSLRNIDKFMSTTMIIKKIVFEEIGGFDENFGVGARWGGSEESEMLIRALNSGFKAYYVPSLVAYHPEADFSKVSMREAVSKGYNYGLGRGAMFGKFLHQTNYWTILGYWMLSLMKSTFGMCRSFVLGEFKDSCKHGAAFGGRLNGFIQARFLNE